VISSRRVNNSNSSSGAGVGARQPENSAGTSVITSNSFFGVSQRKGYHPGEAYERTGWMNALYSWERDSLERPHDADAMEQSALKRGKNYCTTVSLPQCDGAVPTPLSERWAELAR